MLQIILTQKKIDDFLNALQLEQKNPQVIAEYQRNLMSLKSISEKNADCLNKEVLKQWHQGQIQSGLAQGTITNRVVRINHFLRYFNCEELCFPKGGRKDLTGMQFGKLTVLEATEKKASDRSIYWKCRCNRCGKVKEIPANQLVKGVQTSCGCERSERLQETNGYVDDTCLKKIYSDKINRNNTSGHKGVYRKRGKWAAKIQYKKKNYYLGAYESLEDAVCIRKRAENWIREDAQELLEQFQEKDRKDLHMEEV